MISNYPTELLFQFMLELAPSVPKKAGRRGLYKTTTP
jgi:hypothetical protein